MMYIHVSLGCMEDGTTIGDVELPPWAKGDPQEFIRVHREVSDLEVVWFLIDKDFCPKVLVIFVSAIFI